MFLNIKIEHEQPAIQTQNAIERTGAIKANQTVKTQKLLSTSAVIRPQPTTNKGHYRAHTSDMSN